MPTVVVGFSCYSSADLLNWKNDGIVLPVNGMPNTFIYMADIWRHYNSIDSRYVWLPVRFKYGTPIL